MNDILHDVSWVVAYRNDFLTPIFKAFTWIGYPTFVMLLLPLGYWLWSKKLFTRLSVVVILSTLLNAFLKDYWENPRPDQAFALDPGVGKSFGMPSGHAQISAVLWFGIAYQANKKWMWFLAGFLVAGVAMSRIYLGVHDLEDILVGLALAVLCLGLFAQMIGSNFSNFRERSVWLHVAIVVVISAIAYALWPGQGHTLNALALSGFLVGWLVGADLDRRYIKFEIRDGIWFKPLVAVLGIAGLVGMITLLKPLLSGLDPLLAGIIQTAFIGFYMTAVGPYLFKLLKLDRWA